MRIGITRRNQKAFKTHNYANDRIPTIPLLQFSRLYGPAKLGDLVLETLKREDVERVLKIASRQEMEYIEFKAAKRGILPRSDLSLLLQQRQEKILENLGFADPSIQEVQITPRNTHFHVLINTHEMQPQDSAQTLEALI